LAVISHMGDLGESQGYYITFIKIFNWWFRFDDRNVDAVEKSAAVRENFPQAEGSTQTGRILIYAADNWTNGSVKSSLIKDYLFFILTLISRSIIRPLSTYNLFYRAFSDPSWEITVFNLWMRFTDLDPIDSSYRLSIRLIYLLAYLYRKGLSHQV
jgi:hypothetical protein